MFLDMVRFYTEKHGKLPYDPWTAHPIPLTDLLACAKAQGTTFRRTDILILRMGFMQRFNGATQEERDGLAGKKETLCVPLYGRFLVAATRAGLSWFSTAPESSRART